MTVLDTFRLDGAVAMITGGARHLGADMARTFAECGAAVCITSRDGSAAERTAHQLAGETGSPTLGLGLDVTDYDSVEAAIDFFY